MNALVAPPAIDVLDQERFFLSHAIPWPEGSEGYANLHWSELKSGADRPTWYGRACRTLDDMIRTLDWIKSQPGKREIYVCMSSQREAKESINKNGYKYMDALRSQHNVLALKALYLDIDFRLTRHPPTP